MSLNYVSEDIKSVNIKSVVREYLNMLPDNTDFKIVPVMGANNSKHTAVTHYDLHKGDLFIITLFKTYYSTLYKCDKMSQLQIKKNNLLAIIKNKKQLSF